MGRPQVERIRALERAAESVWHERCEDAVTNSAQSSPHCASAMTGTAWDTDLVREALETEIAEETKSSIHTIRVVLDARLAGRELVIPEIEPEAEVEPSVVENRSPAGAMRTLHGRSISPPTGSNLNRPTPLLIRIDRSSKRMRLLQRIPLPPLQH